MMLDQAAGALGLKKMAMIGGLIGAIVSLRFFPEITTWPGRATTLLSGWACAAYVTPLVGALLDVAEKHEGGVAFLLGVLGMAVIANVIKALPEWMAALKGRIGG